MFARCDLADFGDGDSSYSFKVSDFDELIGKVAGRIFGLE
jgi:hypothetical protein